MNISIIGAATTKFGELWDVSPRSLVGEAVEGAMREADIAPSQIQAIYVGNMLSSQLGNQDHLGAFYSEELGMTSSALRVEGACASGGLAVHTGVAAIASGLYDTVLVVGVEKMTDFKPEEVATALMSAGSEDERECGASFPALYAMMARVHMNMYGTREEDMAHVAVKNHYHASLNGHAQFPFLITVEQVLRSPQVASPLKLLDCSPISDGAAALILHNTKKRSPSRRVEIAASAVSTDTLGLANRRDLTSLHAVVSAGKKAFAMASIGPADIDIAEVHDCFTIAEIMALEDLSFYKKGEAAHAIARGETTLGGKGVVVNTSGGLKACGHPVGATGVKQVVELYQQLKGQGGKKQVEGARIGLAHNVGGSGGTAVIHILKSEK